MLSTETTRLDVKKWCHRCGEPVYVEEYTEYEDGFVFYVEDRCSQCGETNLEDYHECPVCREEIPEDNEFCDECLTDINQVLTELMNKWGIDADTLESLIMHHYGCVQKGAKQWH